MSAAVLDRGKLAVLAMFLLAACAAAFGWWWNYRRGERCLALYGSQAAALIRTAPTVEILEIDPAAGEAVVRRIDISRAPGLLNARAALLDDASFEWDSPPPANPSFLPRLVRFADSRSEVRVRFAPDQRIIEVLPEGRRATLDAKTAEGWRKFMERYQ